MAITIRAIRDDAVRRLSDAGIATAGREAFWMLCHVLDLTGASLLSRLDDPVPVAAAARFAALIDRRRRREPLQYILGSTSFFGLELEVNPAVLIPRPETEELVQCVLDHLPPGRRWRIADMGTGSGCIALAIKKNLPDASIVACDIDVGALAVARRNATGHDLDLEFLEADMLSESIIEKIDGIFDAVVSNPPYLSTAEVSELEPEVAQFEPQVALFSEGDPLQFFKALGRIGKTVLCAGGRIFVECHAERAADVVAIFRSDGYRNVRIQRDVGGHHRIVIAEFGQSANRTE